MCINLPADEEKSAIHGVCETNGTARQFSRLFKDQHRSTNNIVVNAVTPAGLLRYFMCELFAPFDRRV
jgi:hypothetical protein